MGKTRNDISEKLNILIKATLNEIDGVEKIYLFGSYAYGSPTEDSDIDLMVITDSEVKDSILREADIRFKTWGKVGVFDMLVESKATFNNRRLKYQLEEKIYTEGEVLYEKSMI
ncbi:MAG: nucleotidyltransferase domain-containing protein [Treponema sp.]|jgi:predicted nucleotidyltransferase|nr:nucleotidyltransferase domain-containing protein [Treponema sp.]